MVTSGMALNRRGTKVVGQMILAYSVDTKDCPNSIFLDWDQFRSRPPSISDIMAKKYQYLALIVLQMMMMKAELKGREEEFDPPSGLGTLGGGGGLFSLS